MKYTFVLAGLAASAVANPWVNIEVSEDGALDASRHNHREHGLRHHNGRHHEHHNEHWWSGLLGRSRSPSRNGRGRSNRDWDNHRNHDRNHDRSMRLGQTDDNDDNDDDPDWPGDNSIYECILTARHNRDERKSTRDCCDEQGGELYEARGHCIFRDVIEDPQEEWRQCALEQGGTDFAACYRREQREIDDELAGRGRHKHRADRGHSHHGRDHRGRKHRDHRLMSVFSDDQNHDGNDNDDDGDHRHKHRKNNQYECRVDLADDNRRREILQLCCVKDVQGRIDHGEHICQINHKEDREEFENCALAEGAENAECYMPKDTELEL